MPNVPVPDALRDDLRLSGLVVWEAKRQRKGEPISLTLAGPGLTAMPMGFGLTIEDATADALRNPMFLRERPGVLGAMARLERALFDLRWAMWQAARPNWKDNLDDDVPF